MDKRGLFVTLAASAVLVGCAGHRGPGLPGSGSGESSCDGANCQITVTVDCSTAPCMAKAVPKTLDVLPPHGAKVIHWKLDAPQEYVFVDEKVEFAPGAPFRCPPPGEGKREVTCVDNHQEPGTYGYTLAVMKAGDPASRIPVDPWIINR